MNKLMLFLLVALIFGGYSVYGQIEVEDIVEEIIDVPVVEDPGKAAEPADEPPVEAEPEVEEDKLSFINGDGLRGLLVSVDSKKTLLTMQSPYAAKPIEFDLASADQVELKPRDSDPKKWGSASIHLSNDDEIWGDIVSLDENAVTLETWYSGTIKIQRSMIARIMVRNKDSSVMYEGPNSMSEWTVGRSGRDKAWEFRKGWLYALQQQASIARKIKDMPDKVKIEFEMSWLGSYPAMAISFFGDNLTRQADCYTLTISGRSVYLYQFTQRSGSSHLGNAELPSAGSAASRGGKFTILADRKEKTVALMFDGVLVRQWTNQAGNETTGDVLMFSPQGQGGIKIGNIIVSEWDGRIPQGLGDTKEKAVEDLLRLGNGDKVSGKVLSIADASIKFKASYADMEIPLTRVVEITFSNEQVEQARKNQHDVRFKLRNGGTVTFDLNGLKGDLASGNSENFGAIELPLSAVRSIEYNIYSEKLKESEGTF